MTAEIQVFSTPTCPYCTKVKQWLNENDYEFEEHNVAEDRDKAREMIEKTGQKGVPQVFVGDEAVIGYRPDKIEEAIENLEE
ncbi:NrdH-redoxin [Candidatus Nanohaloarchaea archaeon]|nr:NrdH-redoxin [Candidatus Nanohaloarchaea archaeon]